MRVETRRPDGAFRGAIAVEDSWDAYWARDANRPYWEQPDSDLVAWLAGLDRGSIHDALDLGCGIGRHVRCLFDAGFRVTAVDSSREALEVLSRHVAHLPVRPAMMRGNCCDDLFPANSFDLVLAHNVIYHGTRLSMKAAVDNVCRWLRPGGLFYFTCPSRRDGKYGRGAQVELHTYRPDNSVHPGDIHYFADQNDLDDLLQRYVITLRDVEEHYWDNAGSREFSSHWRVVARKPPTDGALPAA